MYKRRKHEPQASNLSKAFQNYEIQNTETSIYSSCRFHKGIFHQIAILLCFVSSFRHGSFIPWREIFPHALILSARIIAS